MKLPLTLKVFFSVTVLTVLLFLSAIVECAQNESTTTPRAVLITVSNSTAKPIITSTSPKSVESELNKSVNDNDDTSLTTTESATVATEAITNSSIDEDNSTNSTDSNADKEIESEGNDDVEKNEESEEPSEEGGEENSNDNDGGGENDRPEGGGSEEEEPEDGESEDRCTFNQFLSGLNISHYLPSDRGSLRDEFEGFEDAPERIRHSPSVNYTIQRLKRLLNLANGITSRQELRSGFASFIQHNYELFLELELDAPCMTSIISIIAAMRRSELWAIKCKSFNSGLAFSLLCL